MLKRRFRDSSKLTIDKTGDWAHVWSDDGSAHSWTIAAFSETAQSDNTLLSHNGFIGGKSGVKPSKVPDEGAACHELIPRVAIAHAALLSQLEQR